MGSTSFLASLYASIPALSATIALMYAVSASVFLAGWREASLSSLLGGTTCLRAGALWIVAVGVAVHRRRSSYLASSSVVHHVEDNETGLPLVLDLATSVAFAVASWWLLRQVRTILVEGGPPPRPSAFLLDETKDGDCSNHMSSSSSSSSSSSGKVVVITGCNQGIGKETLRLLFSPPESSSPLDMPLPPSESSKQANGRGSNKIGAAGSTPRHTVILCCRSVDKARQAAVDVGLLVPQHRIGDDDEAAAAGTTTTTTTNGDRQQHKDHNGAAYTSLPRVNVELVELDLSDLAQVRTAARRIVELHPTIHVLVNNAGLMMDRQQFADQHQNQQQQNQKHDDDNSIPSSPSSSLPYELVMTANHLGHFLLTRLLRPAECVVNVSSCTYSLSDPSFLDDLFCTTGTRKYTMFGQYAASKAANLLFTAELSRRVVQVERRRLRRPEKRPPHEPDASEDENESVRKYPMCHAVHPGMVRTNVVRNMPWYLRIPNDLLGFLVSPFQKTPEQGAWNTVHAINETYRNHLQPNGHSNSSPSWTYWVNRRRSDVLPWIHDKDTARRLWEMSSDLVQLPHDYYYDSNEHQDDN